MNNRFLNVGLPVGLAAIALVIAILALVGVNAPVLQGVTNFDSLTLSNDLIVGDDLAVTGDTDLTGDVTVTGDVVVVGDTTLVTQTGRFLIEGDTDEDQLTVTGYTTQTNSLLVLEQSGGTEVFDVTGDGSILNSAGAVTITDNAMVDGTANAIQLVVQGYTTQTNVLQTWEQSDGTDVGTLSNAGALDVASTVNYGANDMYPLGYVSSGQELVCGSSTITGDNQTITVSALTTVTYALAQMATDPGTSVGAPALFTMDEPAGASNTFVVNVWQDDFTTAATSTATILWCAVGDE